MSGDFDPREYDTREWYDGIHDREDEWLVIGPDHDVPHVTSRTTTTRASATTLGVRNRLSSESPNVAI